MQYTEGQLGRVFVVRIDDGEDMLVSLRQFILDKDIQAGSITFLGALMNGRMVTGPEEPVIPPVPHFVMFEGGWEVFGIGTIYPGEGGPHIHYHASVGRSGHALTGCLRETAITYLIIEAVIMEFTGLKARREIDPKTQLHLPVLGDRGDAVKLTDFEKPVEKKEEAHPLEKKEEKDGLSGELDEIIRDLTRRPPSRHS
ncbi:MAG: DNA-binding protein [Methanoregula sp.]|nr:DNA-binding protein [Methanoregula sp.]